MHVFSFRRDSILDCSELLGNHMGGWGLCLCKNWRQCLWWVWSVPLVIFCLYIFYFCVFVLLCPQAPSGLIQQLSFLPSIFPGIADSVAALFLWQVFVCVYCESWNVFVTLCICSLLWTFKSFIASLFNNNDFIEMQLGHISRTK